MAGLCFAHGGPKGPPSRSTLIYCMRPWPGGRKGPPSFFASLAPCRRGAPSPRLGRCGAGRPPPRALSHPPGFSARALLRWGPFPGSVGHSLPPQSRGVPLCPVRAVVRLLLALPPAVGPRGPLGRSPGPPCSPLRASGPGGSCPGGIFLPFPPGLFCARVLRPLRFFLRRGFLPCAPPVPAAPAGGSGEAAGPAGGPAGPRAALRPGSPGVFPVKPCALSF